MVLEHWSPFNGLRRMDTATNRLWRGFGYTDGVRVNAWAVPLDVAQEDDRIVVQASMPGIAPDDIQVTIEDGVLIIKGETKTDREGHKGNYLVRERRTGRFHRALRLPDTVDTDQAEPRYDNGVLTIEFPKVEARKARRLEIKAGA